MSTELGLTAKQSQNSYPSIDKGNHSTTLTNAVTNQPGKCNTTTQRAKLLGQCQSLCSLASNIASPFEHHTRVAFKGSDQLKDYEQLNKVQQNASLKVRMVYLISFYQCLVQITYYLVNDVFFCNQESPFFEVMLNKRTVNASSSRVAIMLQLNQSSTQPVAAECLSKEPSEQGLNTLEAVAESDARESVKESLSVPVPFNKNAKAANCLIRALQKLLHAANRFRNGRETMIQELRKIVEDNVSSTNIQSLMQKLEDSQIFKCYSNLSFYERNSPLFRYRQTSLPTITPTGEDTLTEFANRIPETFQELGFEVNEARSTKSKCYARLRNPHENAESSKFKQLSLNFSISVESDFVVVRYVSNHKMNNEYLDFLMFLGNEISLEDRGLGSGIVMEFEEFEQVKYHTFTIQHRPSQSDSIESLRYNVLIALDILIIYAIVLANRNWQFQSQALFKEIRHYMNIHNFLAICDPTPAQD